MNVPLTTSSPTTLAEWQETGEALLGELARLRLLADKVAHVHGPSHPEMTEFAAVAGAILDIAAAQVARLNDGDRTIPAEEATQLTAALSRLRSLSNAFTPWPGSCASVYLLMRGWSMASALLIERLEHAASG